MLTLRTLGELQLLSGPDPVAISRVREMAFLTYLSCNAERTVTRAHLAAMFWPQSNQAHGLHSLSQAMYRLTRRARGLSFGGDSRVIAVDARTLEVDFAEFRRHLQQREFVLARALGCHSSIASVRARDWGGARLRNRGQHPDRMPESVRPSPRWAFWDRRIRPCGVPTGGGDPRRRRYGAGAIRRRA